MMNIKKISTVVFAMTAILAVATQAKAQDQVFDACSAKWLSDYQNTTMLMSATVLSRLTLRVDEETGPVYAARCENDHFSCESRIFHIVNAAHREALASDVDPWLVLAMIWNESRFNPYAASHLGTRGVMQLHPRNRRFSHIRFVHNERYRNTCRRRPGNCQGQVIHAGVSLIADAIERCDGSVDQGLVMYNTGRCRFRGITYASNALDERDQFEQIAEDLLCGNDT